MSKLLQNTIRFFKVNSSNKRFVNLSLPQPPNSHNNGELHPLIDKFGRKHTYLRISLTEKCNLRCTYCMPEEGVNLTPSEKLLTQDEIFRLAKIFAANGVEKIRLTGGEPTIRRDLVEIVGRLSKIIGLNEIGITSNGIVLARKLDELIKAGLTHVNVSLDTLDSNKYLIMTRRNGFDKVIKLIKNTNAQLPNQLKINCVVIRGVNDCEINDFVSMTENLNIDVRFIEYMPFGGNRFEACKMISYKEMLKQIESRFPDVIRLDDLSNSTSKAYKVTGFKGQFGFITSMSKHFCATCNRLRITADGNLKVCLHGSAETSLRDKLRSGASDAEIVDFISKSLRRKKARHAGMQNLINMPNRPMILIGGLDTIVSTPNRKSFNIPNIHFKYLNLKARYTYQQLVGYKYFSRHSLLSCFKFFTKSVYLFSTYQNDINLECKTLTHLNANGRASMIDVSHKTNTLRTALASATVKFPKEIFFKIFDKIGQCDDGVVWHKKGDIFAAARLAGIAAAKRTSDLIPLCHNVSLSHVEIRFQLNKSTSNLCVYSRVKCTAKTGVEMEALLGCSLAALTIYDMCKALSHKIIISDVKLLGKIGGKSQIGKIDWAAKPNL